MVHRRQQTKTLEFELFLLCPAVVRILGHSLSHLEVRPRQRYVTDVCRLRRVITLRTNKPTIDIAHKAPLTLLTVNR